MIGELAVKGVIAIQPDLNYCRAHVGIGERLQDAFSGQTEIILVRPPDAGIFEFLICLPDDGFDFRIVCISDQDNRGFALGASGLLAKKIFIGVVA